MRTHSHLPLALGAAAVCALALAGCSTAAAPAASDDGPRIVTTTTQVTDFTTRLLEGDGAEITPLLDPGQSVHAFEATAADLAAIAGADAVVVSGAGLETWLDQTLTAAGFSGQVIDASTGIELGGEHADDEHATDEHAEHTEEEHAEDEHATEEHAEHADEGHAEDAEHTSDDGHDHSGANPHIWTSPANAERMVANIATGLEALEGADTALVDANELAYTTQLQDLDAWITESMATVAPERRLLVTNHDSLHYYDDAYDITFVGSIMPSWDDNAEPSAADLDALIAAIRSSGATAVFSEAQLSPTTAEQIASETGVTVYSGPDALYTDALGAADSAGATYLSATAHNTAVLVRAWGGEPSPLPAGIEVA